MLRAPIVKDDAIIANTNEESIVLTIERDEYVCRVDKRRSPESVGAGCPYVEDEAAQ